MKRSRTKRARMLGGALSIITLMAMALTAAPAHAGAAPQAGAGAATLGHGSDLTAQQRSVLRGIAASTWKYFGADIDPATHLPMDNLGPGTVTGAYTSAADIGVYLWSVVSAHDLGLISRPQADSLITATLTTVKGMKRYDGFLYQWYDTT